MNHRKSILIVEDDAPLRSFLMELLDREDRSVLMAPTLRDAYAVLAAQPVNLILLDLFLPDGNGLQLLNDISRKNPELKQYPDTIVITAFGNWESHIQAYKLGAQYFLDKPFKITQMKTLVERALQADGTPQNV